VLELHGEIDISRKAWIEQKLDQIEQFGPQTVTVVDLSDVDYFDTTLLNALLRVQKRMDAEHFASSICVVLPPNKFFLQMFTITKLDRVFRAFDAVPAARRYAEFPTVSGDIDGPELHSSQSKMQISPGV